MILKAAILAFVGSGAMLSAQAPTQPSTPAFEVASIKPTQTGPESALWRFRNERFTARYVTLKALIQSAYGRPENVLTTQQVEGGPEWLDKERFDVEATAPGTPDSPRGSFDATVLTMLRNLLEQRFSLEAHFVTREVPTFALVPAKQDGTLGPSLQRTTVPCTSAARHGVLDARRSSELRGVRPVMDQGQGRGTPAVHTGVRLSDRPQTRSRRQRVEGCSSSQGKVRAPDAGESRPRRGGTEGSNASWLA